MHASIEESYCNRVRVGVGRGKDAVEKEAARSGEAV